MRTTKFYFLFIAFSCCLLVGLPGFSQDSTGVPVASHLRSEIPGAQRADSAVVELRRYSEDKLASLKEDPELSYGYTQARMTLWDAFWQWFWYQLRDLFQEGEGSPQWDQLILFVLFAAALVYAIIRLLKFNTLRIFYGEKDKKPLEHAIEEEDIHEMDFDTLMKEATAAGNYRLAVRLLYLWALKLLTDANHVNWEPGKTNHDYLAELRGSDLKTGFRQLSYYFEHAWYGNFSVTPDLYKKVSRLFNDWKTTL